MITMILFFALRLTEVHLEHDDFFKNQLNEAIIDGFYDGNPPPDAYLINLE